MDLKPVIQTSDPLHVQVEQFLRHQILHGRLREGDPLPPTHELGHQWGINHLAIQKAMKHLVRDGLLVRRQRKGTFVRKKPARFAIGILVAASLMEQSHYFGRAVVHYLQLEIQQKPDWICRVYDGIGHTLDASQNLPSHQHLRSDFQNHVYAGIIQLVPQFDAFQLLIPGVDLPIVRLAPLLKNAPGDVMLDYGHFGMETIRFLSQQGIQKIAYLRAFCNYDWGKIPDLDGVQKACATWNLPPVEIHHLKADTGGTHLEKASYEKTLRLIETWKSKRQWPEALLVSDDIAMRGAAMALLQKNIPIRDLSKPQRPASSQLAVVTMANEGVEHLYVSPIARYELSPQKIALELVRILGEKINGASPTPTPVMIQGQIKT
ncbi:MAG: GntR family transcriptional regulator [Verrucomicrobiae bacterium]|nr:GntR family transcriptional regulator [Verrucomicrobiae bacterium]